MFLDGLEDAYDKGRLMGTFAEDCAREVPVHPRGSRTTSPSPRWSAPRRRSTTAAFAWEIAPVALKAGKGDRFVDKDEQPFKANFDKIPQLKPAFRKDGTVTAANSSSISDGAAALVLMRRSRGREARPEAARAHRRPRDPCAGAGLVHHRAGRRHPQAVREAPAGARRTSTCTRSTRPSPWSPWRRCRSSACRTTR